MNIFGFDDGSIQEINTKINLMNQIGLHVLWASDWETLWISSVRIHGKLMNQV